VKKYREGKMKKNLREWKVWNSISSSSWNFEKNDSVPFASWISEFFFRASL